MRSSGKSNDANTSRSLISWRCGFVGIGESLRGLEDDGHTASSEEPRNNMERRVGSWQRARLGAWVIHSPLCTETHKHETKAKPPEAARTLWHDKEFGHNVGRQLYHSGDRVGGRASEDAEPKNRHKKLRGVLVLKTAPSKTDMNKLIRLRVLRLARRTKHQGPEEPH